MRVVDQRGITWVVCTRGDAVAVQPAAQIGVGQIAWKAARQQAQFFASSRFKRAGVSADFHAADGRSHASRHRPVVALYLRQTQAASTKRTQPGIMTESGNGRRSIQERGALG